LLIDLILGKGIISGSAFTKTAVIALISRVAGTHLDFVTIPAIVATVDFVIVFAGTVSTAFVWARHTGASFTLKGGEALTLSGVSITDSFSGTLKVIMTVPLNAIYDISPSLSIGTFTLRAIDTLPVAMTATFVVASTGTMSKTWIFSTGAKSLGSDKEGEDNQ